MARYVVEIEGTCPCFKTLNVEAEDEEEARWKALQEDGEEEEQEMDEGAAEYTTVVSCKLEEEPDQEYEDEDEYEDEEGVDVEV